MGFAVHTRVGNYEILRLLGAGGMGDVYLARDLRLDREVALKTLPRDLALDPERLARFEREARTIAALNHPHIVTLFGLEEVDGVRLLVMERVSGRPLSSLVGAVELSAPALLRLAIPIADALAAAHERGIVHRDLKPANVMMNDEGQVKVLDFGLATTVRYAGADVSTAEGPLTAKGQVLGTVPYMAPEQLRGEPVDARVDIFAFGALLYELAAGIRPFRGASAVEVGAAILREEPRPLESLRPDLPARFTRLVRRCLEKSARDRVQSALDLRHELQDLADELRLTPAGGASARSPDASRGPAGTAAPARSRYLRWVAIGSTMAAAAAAWFLWTPRAYPPGLSQVDNIRSIAVLPFENVTRDPSEDYFVEGMHEALITDLAKLGTVRVTSRNSVMQYPDHPASTREIARQLDVDALIEGSVLHAGNQVRISAQLILGDTDEHVWAENYDRDLGDVLNLLSDVSRSIATAVQARLGGEAPPDVRRAMLRVNPDAYEEFLRGQQVLREGVDPTILDQATGHFREAIRLDPDLAPAWGGLAMSTAIAGFFGWTPRLEAAAAAREAATKAIALDGTDGTGLGALGLSELYFDWQFDPARADLERALQLSPHDPLTRHAYADYLMITGNRDESVAQVKIARSNDPLSPLANAIVLQHIVYAHRYDEALEEAARIAERVANVPLLDEARFTALWEQGRYEDALAVRRSTSDDPADDEAFESAFRRGGPSAAFAAYCTRLAGRASVESLNPYSMAQCYGRADQPDAAFRWLDRAYTARTPTLLHLTADPAFDAIRDDPRFDDLVRQIGLPADTPYTR